MCDITIPSAGSLNPRVCGDGDERAEIFLIGQNPGQNEVMECRPFVGKAGKRLDAALSAAGLKRKDIYITNACKCFTEGNVDPAPEYQAACRHWLVKELRAVMPKVIVLLGASAHRSYAALVAENQKTRVIDTPSVGRIILIDYQGDDNAWKVPPYSVDACRKLNLFDSPFGKAMFTVHPMYTGYNPEAFPILVKSLQVAKHVAAKL
jgi:uracil-DNA glycosylase family 4